MPIDTAAAKSRAGASLAGRGGVNLTQGSGSGSMTDGCAC